MKSRAGRIAAAAVLLGLAVYGLWMWYGQDYRVRFGPQDLALAVQVTGLDRPGRARLTVRLRNCGKTSLLVWGGPDLGPPIEVVLVNADTGGAVTRRAAPPAPASLLCRSLRIGEEHSCGALLGELYGELPAGNYRLRVIYDTRGPAGRGEKWAEELDLGTVESPPESFAVRASPANGPPSSEGTGASRRP